MSNAGSELDCEFLAHTPIFAGLPERVIGLIARSVHKVELAAGEVLLREGDPARSMFVVRNGEIEIFKHGNAGAEQRLAILKPSDCLGEMSLIDIQPRSATARAWGAATVYVLDLAELAKLYSNDIEAYALLILNISREISRRLRCADELIVSMGITADTLWSDAADTAAHSSRLVAIEPS